MGFVMWYSWSAIASFDAWHETVKQLLGIPHPGYNTLTGEIDVNAQWTTAYTQSVVVAENDVRAYVEDTVAELVPQGLGVLSESPPEPDDPV